MGATADKHDPTTVDKIVDKRGDEQVMTKMIGGEGEFVTVDGTPHTVDDLNAGVADDGVQRRSLAGLSQPFGCPGDGAKVSQVDVERFDTRLRYALPKTSGRRLAAHFVAVPEDDVPAAPREVRCGVQAEASGCPVMTTVFMV